MTISGVEVYAADVKQMPDKTPVYIEFSESDAFTSQWGIVDQKRHATIHKDFVLTFNDKCRYYSLCNHFPKEEGKKGVIVNF